MADGGGTTGTGGGEFVLKPWELHGEGREFERIGRELAKTVGALERDVSALGTPWGADQPGSGFAAVYGQAHGELTGGLRGLAGRLDQIGTGLHAMAARTTDTDTSAATAFGPGAAGPAKPAAVDAAAVDAVVVRPAAGTPPVVKPAVAATPVVAPVVPTDMAV
ncbi:hypothetical protein ACIPLC_01310 [Kitasatospora sp. NPDC086801]|uniref:hypothetical protein n=1 Tax=Kitasatospora sp. NPDC086801 TaxID=3364066 RepID=UPI0037FFCB10